MEMRRYKDILAVKSDDAVVAFHARNLEVAQLSSEAWAELQTGSGEALQELQSWNEENSADVKDTRIENVVRYLTINVTQICNLHCTYCAAGGDGSFGDAVSRISVEKTLPQMKYFLQRLPAKASFNVNFLGGEPLLYPEALEMIAAYIREQDPERVVHYTVITNGTLLSEKTVDLLARLHAHVTISVDGPAEINDRMRPTKNGTSSTALVVAGLQRVLARKNEFGRLMLHGVFDSGNMAIEKAYEFYSQFAVDSYEFSFSVADTNPQSNQEYMSQMEKIAALAYARGGETELRKIRLFEQYFSALDLQRRTENHCGAGKSFLMIDARNRVYTCPWDVNEKSEQVGQGTDIDEKALEAYQKPILEMNNCQSCWARYLCGGGCMFAHKHASGDKHVKNTLFCERTRFTAALAFVYYSKCRSAA